MPLKIVVWNIQNFTYNKIAVDQFELAPIINQYGQLLNHIPYGSMRCDYILDNAMVMDADIFVVIEVISSRGAKGSLVPDTCSGGEGLIALLKLLQLNSSNFWSLVPPLRMVDKVVVEQISGGISIKKEGQYTESVGVFYRSDRLDFIGPYVWPLAISNDNPDKTPVPQDPLNPVTTGEYPAPWNTTLPHGNHYAAQFEYRNSYGSEIYFNGADCRRPITTRFRERNDDQRIITLASVHYPPLRSRGGANHNATQALANTLKYFSPPAYPLQPNEIVIVAGDYNLNAYPPSRQEDVIRSIYLWNYKLVFAGENAQPSMYKDRYDSTTTDYINPLGLDNAAYRTGAALAGLDVKGIMLNRVISQPAVPSNSLMLNNLAFLRTLPQPDQNNIFRLPQNYMKLGKGLKGTSDHMAMYITF